MQYADNRHAWYFGATNVFRSICRYFAHARKHGRQEKPAATCRAVRKHFSSCKMKYWPEALTKPLGRLLGALKTKCIHHTPEHGNTSHNPHQKNSPQKFHCLLKMFLCCSTLQCCVQCSVIQWVLVQMWLPFDPLKNDHCFVSVFKS